MSTIVTSPARLLRAELRADQFNVGNHIIDWTDPRHRAVTVTWIKSSRRATWVGSTGQASFAEREAFVINKVKPAHTRRALTRITGRKLTFAYVLFARTAGVTNLIDYLPESPLFPTLDAAKQAAETIATTGST